MLEIASYVGVKPLLFGMTQSEAEIKVGPPLTKILNNLGEVNAQYQLFSVRYSKQSNEVVEIGVSSNAITFINNIDIFNDKHAFQKLLRQDSKPYEYFGFVILLDLGITLTGFHDDDPTQRAHTAFARGRWDILKGQLKELRTF
jgi:hypothetical protein